MSIVLNVIILTLTSLAHTQTSPVYQEPLTSMEFVYVQPGTYSQGDLTRSGPSG